MPGILMTALLSGIVALWVSLSLRKLWKDKKSGRACCGGSCSACRGCASKASPKGKPGQS